MPRTLFLSLLFFCRSSVVSEAWDSLASSFLTWTLPCSETNCRLAHSPVSVHTSLHVPFTTQMVYTIFHYSSPLTSTSLFSAFNLWIIRFATSSCRSFEVSSKRASLSLSLNSDTFSSALSHLTRRSCHTIHARGQGSCSADHALMQVTMPFTCTFLFITSSSFPPEPPRRACILIGDDGI